MHCERCLKPCAAEQLEPNGPFSERMCSECRDVFAAAARSSSAPASPVQPLELEQLERELDEQMTPRERAVSEQLEREHRAELERPRRRPYEPPRIEESGSFAIVGGRQWD